MMVMLMMVIMTMLFAKKKQRVDATIR